MDLTSAVRAEGGPDLGKYYTLDETQRAAMRERMRAKWADPEWAARTKAAQAKAWEREALADPELVAAGYTGGSVVDFRNTLAGKRVRRPRVPVGAQPEYLGGMNSAQVGPLNINGNSEPVHSHPIDFEGECAECSALDE